uniref:PRELI/MSF1 domain-containing protein n=1 Tax=Cebus imitator TaxID=2715852 RepID=A0A2K5QKH3_CEBIM
MVTYFLGQSVLQSSWDQVFAAFWQRYPNPYRHSTREVTPDQRLLSRRLLTKTNRMPRWAERLFPADVAHSVYVLEDCIVDPQNQTMTTFTWNINHLYGTFCMQILIWLTYLFSLSDLCFSCKKFLPNLEIKDALKFLQF